MHELRQPDRGGAAEGDPVGAHVHRLRAEAGPMTTEAQRARPPEVAVPATDGAPLVTIEAVRRAPAMRGGGALRPLLPPSGRAAPGGPPVLLKAESLQPIGAFK